MRGVSNRCIKQLFYPVNPARRGRERAHEPLRAPRHGALGPRSRHDTTFDRSTPAWHAHRRTYTGVLLRDLPPRGRWYIIVVIALGALTFGLLVPRATFTPIAPLVFLVLLSSLTSAFKVQFPIASGSNMSVSYVVDIAALMLHGPHATMIVGRRQRLEPDHPELADAQPAVPHAVQHGDPGPDGAGRGPGVPAARRHARRRPCDRSSCRWPAWRSPTSSSTRCRSPSRSR